MLTETLHTIEEQGWSTSSLFSVYAAPVRSYSDKVERSDCITPLSLDREIASLKQTVEAARILAGPDDSIKQQARRLFRGEGNPLPELKESFCSAHTGMYIFDCFADIYACWEKTGDPAVRVGRISPAGQLRMNDAILRQWRARSVASNSVCAKCRYALNCGGGCAILAQHNSGTTNANFCDGYGIRFRESVANAYLEHTSGVDYIERGSKVCDQ